MSFEYKYLVFKPAKIDTNYQDILWKAEVNAPSNYKSIYLILIQDNISHNNRRTLKSWIDFLKENEFKYDIKFSGEYIKNYSILDSENTIDFSLFACDIKASNHFVEINSQYILPILYILDLKKGGIIFPNSLSNRIKHAKNIINNNDDEYIKDKKSYLNIFSQIEKLVQICQNYECDIHYEIIERKIV